MLLEVSFCCDVGNMRENNEDGVLVGTGFFRNACGYVSLELSRTDFPMVFAVADGVGGEEYGEVASEILLRTLAETSPNDLDSLRDVILLTKQRFREYLAQRDLQKEMASTVAGIILLSEESAIVFNVGDSRVYQFKSGYALKVTKDHSLVELLVQTGQLSPEEARTHPQRHVVTSCVSSDANQFELFAKQIIPFQGTSFLICSDGLWEFVTDEEMEEILSLSNVNHAFELVQRAKKNGSNDNISVIVINIK